MVYTCKVRVSFISRNFARNLNSLLSQRPEWRGLRQRARGQNGEQGACEGHNGGFGVRGGQNGEWCGGGMVWHVLYPGSRAIQMFNI